MIPRAVFSRVLRQSTIPRRTIRTLTRPRQVAASSTRFASHVPFQTARWLSSKSLADEKIEEITELYATAQDEFEIAMEETEKVSVYAEEDRKAAREELTKLQEAYKACVDGTDEQLAEEVKRRVGQRIRELEQGVNAMEELAMNQD
ncbi:hypothetical protein TI39_contig384g00011 [Zymoseptoria brevis]|uniref:Uncharacterized protein n=1 Tax=Zymoseptoria brevis TaxID=1047168 RepID=A0A0F4GNT5_9PEZI|nr:hypothetical protein TI39_contig384g00011 [Zymoseptoria brevis]